MRRMYSESELRAFIRNHSEDVIASLVNKDVSIAGLTSKGIANTGALANVGDVAIVGDLSVQGEGKGIITCNEVKEKYDSELIDLSSYINPDVAKSNTLYAKALVKHGVLYIVCSGNFVAQDLSSANNRTILNNFYSAIPEAIRGKICREDGSPINEAPQEPGSGKVVYVVGARTHGSTQAIQLYGLSSYQNGELYLGIRPLPSIAEDTSVFIDIRIFLTI